VTERGGWLSEPRRRPRERSEGFVAGTGSEVAAQVEALGDAGADRVMLQWLDIDDLDRLRNLADAVV
jgi:alkanesulfonate monooxygenase SsuD/methylene tetrahydromethanopterin reductase-like flavin-dependent oxidoreductase (luciferase family)